MIQSSTTHMPCAGPRARHGARRLLVGTMLVLAPWVVSAKEHRADEARGPGTWASGLAFEHLARTTHGTSQEHAASLSFEDRAARRHSKPNGDDRDDRDDRDDGDRALPDLPSAAPVTFAGGGAVPTAGGATNLAPVAAVPEPGTYALMLAGLVAVGFVARRRRAQDR